LALLAATCSKIGAPPHNADEQQGQNGATQQVRVIGANGNGSGEVVVPSWVQLPTGAVVDSSGKQTFGIPFPSLGGSQIIQQSATNSSSQPQIIATAGPGGNLTYNVVQPFQTINVDGQEAILLPSSMAAGNSGQIITGSQQQQQQQTFFTTPVGQIVRAPVQGITAGNAVIPNLGTVVNLGGNMVNLGNVQNMQAVRPNILQTLPVQPQSQVQVGNQPQFIQIPMSTANGQTVMQTVQIPVQGIPVSALLQQQGQITSNSEGTLTTTAGQTQTTVSSSTSQGQPIQLQPQYIEIQANPNISTPSKNEENGNMTTQQPPTVINTQQNNQQQVLQAVQQNAGQTILSSGQNMTPNILSQLPTLVLNTATGQLIPVSNSNGQSFFLGSSAQTNGTSTASISVPSSQQTSAQNIITPQQFATIQMQNQGVSGVQIAGQNQVIPQNPWLSALNVANIRPQGIQTIQVPNLQALQSMQNLQSVQNNSIQGFQLTPQGQLIATGASFPQNLGGVTLTPQGTLTVAGSSQGSQQQSPQAFPATVTNINIQQPVSGNQNLNTAQLLGKKP